MSLQVTKSAPIYTKVGTKYHPAIVRTSRRINRPVLPVLTSAALMVPVTRALYKTRGLRGVNRVEAIGSRLLAYFTGYWPDSQDWQFKRLWSGLIPLAIVMTINRSGIFRPVNSRLARLRIPLRLT